MKVEAEFHEAGMPYILLKYDDGLYAIRTDALKKYWIGNATTYDTETKLIGELKGRIGILEKTLSSIKREIL